MDAKEIIKLYELKPHPEGGFFRETYRSQYYTEAYFFLPKGSRSTLHKIPSDETWHFYLGGPITIAMIQNNGEVKEVVLGSDIKQGQKIKYTVPANLWFGAYPHEGTEYALVGCTVAPPFSFKTFEIGKRSALLQMFPTAKNTVEKLTNQGG